jgi:hypothetical protein
MNKSYSVFVDDKYFYDFVALYNSWKYYESTIPIKVYTAGNLSLHKRFALEKKVEVIDIDREDLTEAQFKGKYLFKWIGLLKHMKEYEILLDADTIFLSNIDFLFDELEKEKLIGAKEDVTVDHKVYVSKDWPLEHKRIQDDLRKYIGSYADLYTQELVTPVYNAGLIGFNKTKHSFLLEKCIEILTSDFDSKKNPTSHLEQFMMALLLQLYNIEIHELNQLEWMNTWMHHKNPKKIIKVENNGKFGLYNETGSKINFYHFTGDIGMVDRSDGQIKSCRPHQIYESTLYEPKFNRSHVEQLWYGKHQNPALLLYEYFANKSL